MIRRLYLRYQLNRSLAKRAIVRKARSEAGKRAHATAVHRAYLNDVLMNSRRAG